MKLSGKDIGATELKVKAPLTLQLVTALVSKNDSRNKQKCGDAHYPGICMAIAIMLKERDREMCGIQTLLSLILFSSRVQKQVKQLVPKIPRNSNYPTSIYKFTHVCLITRASVITLA